MPPTLAAPLLVFSLGSLLFVPQIPTGPGVGPNRTPDRQTTHESSTSVKEYYGPPEPVDLRTLASGVLVRRTVITKGRVGFLDPSNVYFVLEEEGGRVLLMMVPGMAEAALQLMGRRVEVVGYSRELVANQGTCRPGVVQSLCDDSLLPPKPDLTTGREHWPRVSVTSWSISDITGLQRKTDTADDFGAFRGGAMGDKVTLRGQFGGANLEGLLKTSSPEPGAWVLRSGDEAVWVVGKPPRGSGWRFDPNYRGDLGKWVEVEGRIAQCGAETCLKASRVILRPAAPKTDP